MLSVNLNPVLYLAFKQQVLESKGFLCLITPEETPSPPRSGLEIQRFCRIEEDKYRRRIEGGVIRIQTHIRSYFARRTLRHLKQERDKKRKIKSAILIQSYARMWSAQKYVQYLKYIQHIRRVRHEAARVIQRFFKFSLFKKRIKFWSTVNQIMKIRILAAIHIQKFARGFLVRKDLPFIRKQQRHKLIRWPFEAREVYIAGNFTKPPWIHLLPLRYSRYLKEHISTFFIDNKIEPGDYEMKFVADSIWLCNGNLPIAKDINGNYNNIITIKGASRMIRAISARNFLETETITSERNNIVSKIRGSPLVLARTLSGNLDSPRAIGFLSNEDGDSSLGIKLVMAAHMIAHPKVKNSPLTHEGSADAYFIDHDMQIFGLADGVGEWETFGLDPSKFSNELMSHCHYELKSNFDSILEAEENDVSDKVIECTFEAMKRIQSYGSSTFLIGYCTNSNLHTASLGDSGIIVLRLREYSRNYTVVYRSKEQQHSFNCPYQLARLPDPKDYDHLAENGLGTLISLLRRIKRPTHDSPFDSHIEKIVLKQGDIIIAATDGLFDNLFDADIIKVVESIQGKFLPDEKFCKILSRELAEKAVERGWDQNYRSPFSKHAARGGKRFIGGKLDDTTVIVSLAVYDRKDSTTDSVS
jgi:serine/threonine protein phosphatase PrpC